MKNNLITVIKNFIEKEKINFLISEDNNSGFWLDDRNNSVTCRFKIDTLKQEILYDVYLTEYSVHLKEKTLKDVEVLEFISEENKRWKIAESIEEIWLILDQIKIWATKNNFNVKEKKLI